MARPHHRKKHRQHVQQFKHRGDASRETPKSSGKNVLSIVGAFFGLALGYIASSGNIIWMVAGLVLGTLGGYFIGRKVDASAK